MKGTKSLERDENDPQLQDSFNTKEKKTKKVSTYTNDELR